MGWCQLNSTRTWIKLKVTNALVLRRGVDWIEIWFELELTWVLSVFPSGTAPYLTTSKTFGGNSPPLTAMIMQKNKRISRKISRTHLIAMFLVNCFFFLWWGYILFFFFEKVFRMLRKYVTLSNILKIYIWMWSERGMVSPEFNSFCECR